MRPIPGLHSAAFLLLLAGLAGGVGLGVMGRSDSAAAAGKPASAAAPAAAKPSPASPPAPAAMPAGAEGFSLAGFRSAHFGMTEAQVRGAIEKDFALKAEAVKAEANPAEQTQVLSVVVPDLLPGGGRAALAYVLGYKSRTLIQVGITWSKASDPEITPQRLFSNGNILREHFLTLGYRAESVATGGVLAGGLLLFRGADAAGHTTELLLLGTWQKGEDNRRILAPSELTLRYVVDAKNPDIFKLPEGSF